MNVVVVVAEEEEARPLCRWGWRLARALERGLVVLWLPRCGLEPDTEIRRSEELPEGAPPALVDLLAALAPRKRTLAEIHAEHALEGEEEDGVEAPHVVADPTVVVRSLAGRQPQREVLEAAAGMEVSHLLVVPPRTRPRRGSSLARRLFTSCPCNTILLRLGESDPERCDRVLVASAGGPHAEVALRLGGSLVRADGGTATALYVEPTAVEHGTEVGERVLAKGLEAAGVAQEPHFERRVVLSDRVLPAISAVAAEGYDLLLLGAPNLGALRGLLFGSVPERLLVGPDALTVGLVRARWSLVDRMRQRLGRWLELTVPQMGREERIAVFERLQSGSEWNFDFMALIALSTAIATLGLLQNSAAVVIGAMLVAPLMTPILGAGLALVQGNLPLLRSASKSLLYGYVMALAIGFGFGVAVRPEGLTAELLARGGPTLLDMGVAFASGLAAAYCLARPGLLAALPGVAIAAALVPPIATTGVSLAMGETVNAAGAALLFGTNVVVIILGAAASLWAGGVRRRSGQTTGQRWARVGLLALLVGASILALPLGTGVLDSLRRSRQPIPASLRLAVADRLQAGESRIVSIVERPEGVVEVVIEGTVPVSADEATALAAAIRSELGGATAVRVRTELVVEVESQPPRHRGE